MSKGQIQVDKLLADHEGITHERYAAGLASFHRWYVQRYPDEPDAMLITDEAGLALPDARLVRWLQIPANPDTLLRLIIALYGFTFSFSAITIQPNNKHNNESLETRLQIRQE
jgi:hypothetical protein